MMRSIKEQRNTLNSWDRARKYAELLDWAEKARVNIREMQIRLGNYEYCAFNDSCDCLFCLGNKLLEELPE